LSRQAQVCSSGNWQQVAAAEEVSDNYVGDATFSMRLDQQGRPRIVYYNFVDADTLYYAWSNGNSNSAAGWSSYEMHLPPADERAVDMALDSHGRPKIVYTSDQFNLRYLECTGNCQGPTATWEVQDVETGQELQASEPVPPCSICWGATWWLRGHASLALDAADRPHISYDARHVQFWDSNRSYDRWAIRFAQPGDSSGMQHNLYLPLTVR
jgi:hypothetical protein